MRALSLLLLVAFVCAPTAAQRSRKGSRAPAKKIEARTAFATGPFDITLEKLPPRFIGHDLLAILNAVERAKPDKSEFETTAQFRERVTRAVPPHLVAFAFDQDMMIGDAKYDADTGLMGFRFDPIGGPRQDRPGAVWLESTRAVGSYVGQNAFGVRTRVRQEIRTQYGLCFRFHQESKARSASFLEAYLERKKHTHVQVPMTAAEAKSGKERIRILVIGKLHVDQYTHEILATSIDYDTATVNTPIDRDTEGKWLFLKLEEVWFYDVITGEVYAKRAFPPPAPRPPAEEQASEPAGPGLPRIVLDTENP